MQNVKTVYLAGRITGDPYYRSKFYEAARELEAAGFAVVNPATLPPSGFEYDAYMRISVAMLKECAAACFLPDWKESEGAMNEHGRAAAWGKEIFYFDEWRERAERKATSHGIVTLLTHCSVCKAKEVYTFDVEKLEADKFQGEKQKCPKCGGDLESVKKVGGSYADK